MYIVLNRKRLLYGFLSVGALLIGFGLMLSGGVTKSDGQTVSGKYRVFVSGTGTVEGAWDGSVGIAIIGLTTKQAPEQDRDLKEINVLITNAGNDSIDFNSDFILVNRQGDEFMLSSEGQPKVSIKPGTMSQGTVIIDVPKGTRDDDLTFIVKGGCFPKEIKLPLKVQRIGENS